MRDQKAIEYFRKNDIVGLFRYLGPMWIKVAMEAMEDLVPLGFLPNPDRYRRELAAAGIFVERMELAMLAVLHKAARQTPYGSFRSANEFRFAKLPAQQHEEIREFWFSGTTPGLGGDTDGKKVGTIKYVNRNFDLQPGASFAAGLLEGLRGRMDANNFAIVSTKLLGDPGGFYIHYVEGVFKGFYEGGKGLVELAASLFKLSINFTPAGIAYHAIRAAASRSYAEKLARDASEARLKAEAVVAIMAEFAQNADVYIANSRNAGRIIGDALAGEINAGIAEKSAAEIGSFIGEIIGRVLFEVVILMVTEGAGTAIRAAAATEAGGAAARIATRVADRLRDSLEGLPALRRAFVKILGESQGGMRLALWGRRGAELRLPPVPAGNKNAARAVGKLWREGAAGPEEFSQISGSLKGAKGPQPPRPTSDPSQAPRHITQPRAWPDHVNQMTPEQRRAWLNSPEGRKWNQVDGPLSDLDPHPPHPGPRDHDAEAKMFEELLAKTEKGTAGEFHFKVDRPMCPACKDMIFRFTHDRPGIRVVQHSPDRIIASP